MTDKNIDGYIDDLNRSIADVQGDVSRTAEGITASSAAAEQARAEYKTALNNGDKPSMEIALDNISAAMDQTQRLVAELVEVEAKTIPGLQANQEDLMETARAQCEARRSAVQAAKESVYSAEQKISRCSAIRTLVNELRNRVVGALRGDRKKVG